MCGPCDILGILIKILYFKKTQKTLKFVTGCFWEIDFLAFEKSLHHTSLLVCFIDHSINILYINVLEFSL